MTSHRADSAQLAQLQNYQENIRNFCILAHVDHGKTTLSDSLISSNGIISAKLAGKLRYLDSTEDEQKRGITMHSSAISLLYKTDDNDNTNCSGEYLINLIDSPGHIDFSSDVSTATRMCDGALIMVDVLEGICTQTHAVIYKALKERMRPCLVLNKIDRLCLELQLSTTEAFYHLRRVIENVNALAFTLLNSEIMKRNEAATALVETQLQATDATSKDNTELEEDPMMAQWTFAPERGNVIFASALDGWGFGTAKFATLWANKMSVNKAVLRKYMFDDYMFHSVTKKLIKCDPSRDGSNKPMFATMVLDPLWQLYNIAVTQQDVKKAANMASRGVRLLFNILLVQYYLCATLYSM